MYRSPLDMGKPKRVVERDRLSSWLMGDLGDLEDIGGQRIGWSTNIGNENLVGADVANEKWQRARHSLSEIPLVGGKKQVRFRFALGSDVGSNASGIAIDNFTIRERDRVLLEEFSTEVRDDAFSVHQQNTDLVLGTGDFSINGMDAVRITYGLSFGDRYALSSDEITARQSHYSIAETPFTLLQDISRPYKMGSDY